MYILQSCLPAPQALPPSIFCKTLLASSLPIHNHCASRLRSYVTRLRAKNLQTPIEMNGFGDDQDGEAEDDNWDKDEFPRSGGGFRGGEDEGKDYDKDPEFAEIIGSYLDNPEKARSKMEDRLRRKKNKILHTKAGSSKPMQVKFNKFDFSNSYIWLEFYNTPLDKDISLIRDTIRSWHIIGRLGGCNSMNMQLSQSPMEERPSYDAMQGANVTPTTFYNIGDLEIQDNLARIWVDIGASEPLLLDILINALTQLCSDYIGIKQVMFGGTEFENWSENLRTEEAGVESIYEWKGEIQTDSEKLLIIKTRASLLEDLTERVKANHEYQVPEVIALPITGGNLQYLEWLKNSTRDNDEQS